MAAAMALVVSTATCASAASRDPSVAASISRLAASYDDLTCAVRYKPHERTNHRFKRSQSSGPARTGKSTGRVVVAACRHACRQPKPVVFRGFGIYIRTHRGEDSRGKCVREISSVHVCRRNPVAWLQHLSLVANCQKYAREVLHRSSVKAAASPRIPSFQEPKPDKNGSTAVLNPQRNLRKKKNGVLGFICKKGKCD